MLHSTAAVKDGSLHMMAAHGSGSSTHRVWTTQGCESSSSQPIPRGAELQRRETKSCIAREASCSVLPPPSTLSLLTVGEMRLPLNGAAHRCRSSVPLAHTRVLGDDGGPGHHDDASSG